MVFSAIVCGSCLFPQQPAAIAIEGKVSNASGAPIANAPVRLEHAGSPPANSATTADGRFMFRDLAPGDYTVIAENAGRRSAPVTIHAVQPETHVDLVIGAPAVPAMEFADNPNFTVAAVTDWTAAGGHGSDAVLRTSEALNRDALNLKPAAPPPLDATTDWKQSESVLRAALAAAPHAFEPNHKLGELYLREERFDQAVGPLESAYKADPGNFENEYDLALALKGNVQIPEAREHVQKLIAIRDSGDVHRLAGEIHEKGGDSLAAVHEFELAVRDDPSEQNYFEWGSELLLHRAVWQARDVFTAGVKAYPKSERMLTALGAALFAGALYDQAAQRLCEASDLNPADPEPYTFMGKVEISAPNPLPCVEQKLERYAAQRPADPLANYFYAMALWKQNGPRPDPPTFARVHELLSKAVTLDPQCSDAYLQLGVLEATRRDYQKAIGFYAKAIDANPQSSEAHYRLGIAYDRMGEKEKAAQQLALHEELKKQQAAAIEEQRREVKQFLVVVEGKKLDANP
ncbi:MAG TPA: tetratricopeptide repeat protein [Terracidiphilus sp.]